MLGSYRERVGNTLGNVGEWLNKKMEITRKILFEGEGFRVEGLGPRVYHNHLGWFRGVPFWFENVESLEPRKLATSVLVTFGSGLRGFELNGLAVKGLV